MYSKRAQQAIEDAWGRTVAARQLKDIRERLSQVEAADLVLSRQRLGNGAPKTLATAQGPDLDEIANRRGTGRRQKPTDTGHRLETDMELRARVQRFYGVEEEKGGRISTLNIDGQTFEILNWNGQSTEAVEVKTSPAPKLTYKVSIKT